MSEIDINDYIADDKTIRLEKAWKDYAKDYDYHPNKVMRGVKYIRKIVYIHPIRSRQVAATIIAYCGEFI